MDILKELRPVARKEHICDFCCGTIRVGEKYNRQTIVDGYIYDNISHIHCFEAAYELNMFDRCDSDGLSQEYFSVFIYEYVEEYHYNKFTHEIDKDWQLPLPELVKKVYEEIKDETR